MKDLKTVFSKALSIFLIFTSVNNLSTYSKPYAGLRNTILQRITNYPLTRLCCRCYTNHEKQLLSGDDVFVVINIISLLKLFLLFFFVNYLLYHNIWPTSPSILLISEYSDIMYSVRLYLWEGRYEGLYVCTGGIVQMGRVGESGA